MDREEDIGGPVVGERRDIWVGGRLAAQVVALHRLRRVAVALERDAAVPRDARIDLGFRDIVFEIDRTGIWPAAERMARIDKDTHIALLSHEIDWGMRMDLLIPSTFLPIIIESMRQIQMDYQICPYYYLILQIPSPALTSWPPAWRSRRLLARPRRWPSTWRG